MAGTTTITRHFEIYGASSQADLDFLKPLGFTQLILDSPALAKPAESAEFGVVLANWWNRSTSWNEVLPVLQLAQKLTRLVSVNMMDEPIDNGVEQHAPEVYLKLRQTIRENEFDQPLSLTIYGPHLNWPAPWSRLFLDYLGAIDILRIDPYPIAAGRPLRLVAEWIHQARLLMGVAGVDLPLTVVLQAWDSGEGLPSIGQLRVMAYMAMLSGAETLSFYEYNPSVWDQTQGFTEGFCRLMSELTGLSEEFAGAEITPILGADSLFQAEVHHGGQWTCITVNSRDQPNGLLGPLQIVRESGCCPRPTLASDPDAPRLPADRKRATLPGHRPGSAAAQRPGRATS